MDYANRLKNNGAYVTPKYMGYFCTIFNSNRFSSISVNKPQTDRQLDKKTDTASFL